MLCWASGGKHQGQSGGRRREWKTVRGFVNCSGGNIRCWLGSEIQMLGFVVGGFVILSYIYIYIHMHINM